MQIKRDLLRNFFAVFLCMLNMTLLRCCCAPVYNFCPNTLQNLGHMTGSPKVVSDGHVTLEYTGGDVCSHTANYSTTVTLICSDSGLLVCTLSCDFCPITIYLPDM